ncbi:transmembrane emp24 domain-containing protein 10-like [Sparus aurata]|uniref:Transmembrane emp24 domain-containing protein 10-like n=1 Tax=Sparus aurata TaxID=8175 RepID=A0A671U788_SPAAU|nr:transmembrane emp24 domain-containing protein 10-like [Sparus aurata]
MSRLCVFLLLPVLLGPASAIQFYLPVHSVKCLQEDIHKNVLVTGEYEVSEEPETTTNLKITDSAGDLLFNKENITSGKFSFTTETQDRFNICFHSTLTMGDGKVPDRLVTLKTKHGVDALNQEEIAKVEKLNPLEAKLRTLEHLSNSMADDFVYMRKRGKEMRRTNASTNTRVLFINIISVSCLCSMAIWQVFYLRRFFRTKKLIE